MTALYGPGLELQRVIVQALMADTLIHQYLFGIGPDGVLRAPAVTLPGDVRVYGSDADLPEAIRPILPRILVEVNPMGGTYEQPDPADSGEMRVYTHSFAARGDRLRAEALDFRIRHVFRSTSLSDARIVTAELVPKGQRIIGTEANMDDAHRITTPFVSANAGVLG